MTDYSVAVTLGQNPLSSRTKPIVVFELADAGENPILTWANANELILQLTDPGSVQTSKHESAGIKISYVVPKWMWDNSQTIEADRLRQEEQAQQLYQQRKISDKDLREEIETNNVMAKERSDFRQWIIDNATVSDH